MIGIYKRPGCSPREAEIPDNLDRIHTLICCEGPGRVEALYFAPDAVAFSVYGDPAAPPNLQLGGHRFRGDVIVAARNNQRLVSMTPQQVEIYLRVFKKTRGEAGT